MKTRYIWTIAIVIFVILAGGGIGYYFFNAGTQLGLEYGEVGFEIDTLFLKVAVSENTTAISNIKITNLDSHDESCEIKMNEMNGLISLEEDNFILAPNEVKNLQITFNVEDKAPGVYLGELEIVSQCKTQKIPIILEIQSETVIFDSNVNLYPQGRNVLPGQKLNANIKIFDLANFELSNVKVIYFVRGFDGRTIISEMEEITVDDRYDYSKSFDMPLNIRLGSYVFITTLKYTDILGEESVGTSSIYFNVVEEEEVEGGLGHTTILLILIIFGFFFLVFIGLFIYSLIFRNQMLKEIQGQYQGELRRQRKMIECQRKEDISKLSSNEEKRAYQKEVNQIKKLRLVALKKQKIKKIGDFKLIKRKYKGSKLKSQLIDWKKKGYDTSVLEKNYRMPKVKDIRKKIKEWKKKGYDTSVLEKKKR